MHGDGVSIADASGHWGGVSLADASGCCTNPKRQRGIRGYASTKNPASLQQRGIWGYGPASWLGQNLGRGSAGSGLRELQGGHGRTHHSPREPVPKLPSLPRTTMPCQRSAINRASSLPAPLNQGAKPSTQLKCNPRANGRNQADDNSQSIVKKSLAIVCRAACIYGSWQFFRWQGMNCIISAHSEKLNHRPQLKSRVVKMQRRVVPAVNKTKHWWSASTVRPH